MSVRAAFRIEAQLSVGVWTSLGTDVSRADTVIGRRGMPGGGPLDRMATTGTLEFSLKNGPDGGNPSRLQGYYSPNHANVRSGWTYGIPIRLVSTYSGTDRTLWTGKLRSVDPVPGLYRDRLVRCVAHDCISDLAENGVREIAPQVSQTENALIAAIIAAMPSTARPVAVTYETSLDTYTYGLQDASSGVKAASLLTNVLMSAGAYAYPLVDGTLYIENRQTRANKASSYTFTDADLDEIDVPSDLFDVYNRCRVTMHPVRIDAAATTVLYGIDSALKVNAGASITVWGDYVDPANPQTPIGGTAQVTPIVSGTDYSARPNADGTGVDKTADIAVVTTAFAGAVKFVGTNAGAAAAYLVTGAGVPHLQVRGKGLYDEAPIPFESYTAKDYGDRLLEMDLHYQDDGEVAQSRAAFYVAQYANLADQVRAIQFNPQRSDGLMLEALTAEIGQVKTVTETMTGAASVAVVVQAVEFEITPGPILTMRYVTAPRGPTAVFLLDDAVYGKLDSADARLAYA